MRCPPMRRNKRTLCVVKSTQSNDLEPSSVNNSCFSLFLLLESFDIRKNMFWC